MPIYRTALSVAIAALLYTFAGVSQEAYGQSGETQALQSVEALLELSRSERRRIQMGLAAEGFDTGPTDGLFGRDTRAAIRAWQGSHGKAATGYLDADAARILLAAGEQREAESAGKQQSRNANTDRVDPASAFLRDKYVLGLAKALKADDYPKALAYIDKLRELGGDLPPSVDYFRGEAYLSTKRYFRADKALNRYLSKTGKKGRYYRKSLELLLVTEEKIQELLNDKDKDGNTPLHRAATENDYEAATKLIALGLEVGAKNKGGWTPLQRAVRNNARDVAELLIGAGADLNAKNVNGGTLLHTAAYSNARDVAELLIGAGADLNAKNVNGGTLLHTAAYSNARDVAELFIGAGMDLNAKGQFKWTPLHYAAVYNARDVAELLIGAGADLNAKAKGGATPLHSAARHARDVAELLIGAGADLNAKAEDGDTPLHVAASWALSRVDTVALLIGAGADVNARNAEGKTPLHTAAHTRATSPDVSALLIETGAKVNAQDNDGRTPMDGLATTHATKALLRRYGGRSGKR